MSRPSRNLWERTKDLARRAGEEARTVSVHDLEGSGDEPSTGTPETAGEEDQSDVAANVEQTEENTEDSTDP